MRPSPAVWLAAGALVSAAYAAAIWWVGGFDLRLAGVRLRSHDWVRPALVAAASAAAGAWLGRAPLAAALGRAWVRLESIAAARTLAAAAVAGLAAASAVFSTGVAGGSDSSGYLSQARLFASARLTDGTPLAVDASIPPSALAPLGYSAGAGPGTIVPTYPPGLPLVMAPFARLGAVYVVVPIFALLLVWLTMRLGVALGDPLAGALAAVLVAVSPIVLYQSFQPMSDVPAAACWLAALLLARRPSPAAAASAGFVSSVAVLIRPNLLPLAAVVLLASTVSGRDGRTRRALAFAAAALPAAAALAWIQQVRYGSPFASGYGSPDALYSVANIAPNLARYPRWLTELETPFIWLWLAAPVSPAFRSSRRLGVVALVFVAAVWIAYLPYVAFAPHEWFYTRFLLPALPVMIVLAVMTALSGLRKLPPAWTAAAVVLATGILATSLLRAADARGVFTFQREERRYREAGAYAAARLPANAVVLAGQHSGSVRYYSGRPIVRWDLVDGGALDRMLALLEARGYAPFVVVDADEDADFRRIFAAAGQHAVAGLRPLAEFGRSRVYALDR